MDGTTRTTKLLPDKEKPLPVKTDQLLRPSYSVLGMQNVE